MSRFLGAAALLVVGVIMGVMVSAHHVASPAVADPMMSMPDMSTPVSGYTLHIDASQHYAGHPDEIIHHWCKSDLAPFSRPVVTVG